MHILDVKIYNA